MLLYRNKKVLVTGASGFIGTHLTQALLKEGAIVNALSLDMKDSSQENLHTFKADINNLEILKKAAKDTEIIFHLAAQSAVYYSHKYPFEDFNTNLNGLMNILKVAENKKIVFPSSSSLYTPTKEPIALKETVNIKPKNFYALSKYASELYLINFFNHHNLRSTILRFSYVYGSNQRKGPLYDILSQLSLGKSKIGLFINPHSIIDMVHVNDVVDAMLLAGLNRGSDGEVINISSGSGIRVLDIIKKLKKDIEIENLTDKPFTPKNSINLIMDNKKAEKILKWKPKQDFYKSLEELYKTFKNENS